MIKISYSFSMCRDMQDSITSVVPALPRIGDDIHIAGVKNGATKVVKRVVFHHDQDGRFDEVIVYLTDK